MALVNYRIYGSSGPPVYILHGIFGMLDNWHYVAGHLAKHFTVITFDARNHGKSFHHPNAGYRDMAIDLAKLMDELGHERAHIAGHSMGGKTAMTFADLFPQRLLSLTIIDIAPKAYPPGHTEYFRAFDSIDFSQISSRKEADEAFTPFAPDAGVRQFLLKNLEPVPGNGYRLKINVTALRQHYTEIIGDLQLSGVFGGPALFLTGSKSAYVKDSDKPGIYNHFPNAEFIEVQNAGHWVHADNPEGFLHIFETFLTRIQT
jgi:pimeloyl-ACP methyl ester carboxylesterase